MTKTTLYKKKCGKIYKINDLGKKFIDDNWKSKTKKELAQIIGLTPCSIAKYMKSNGFIKSDRFISYRNLKEKIIGILKPYSGKLTFKEMSKLLGSEYDIELTKEQVAYMLKGSGVKSLHGDKKIRFYIDGNKENKTLENIVSLSKKEYQYVRNMLKEDIASKDLIHTILKLAKLKEAKNKYDIFYEVTNTVTGEITKANNLKELEVLLGKSYRTYYRAKEKSNGDIYVGKFKIVEKLGGRRIYED